MPCRLLAFTYFAVMWTSILADYSRKVLLVSMDGFRWDYLNDNPTPHFDYFAKQGVKLPYMNNSFITETFPNHFTMITGLYEETHGITANFMYDPVFNASFRMTTKESRWWNGGEPLWVTAKKQGLRTGTYYWPGSEVEIRGIRPDHWFPYSYLPSFPQRVDTVVDWFLNDNVTFATLYFDEPDHTGHVYGPMSQEIKDKGREMDGVLGYLVAKLTAKGLINDINIIVTSDHGMTTIDSIKRVVDITDFVDMKAVSRIPSYGPVMQILPEVGQEDAIVKNLTGVDHITVYRKEDMPDRFHYKSNRRIMPVIVIADDGWYIVTNRSREAQRTHKGTHGYDNSLMTMKPIFLARGPNFKTNYNGDVIQNVDIYPLVCKLLNINPAPNNGSLTRVNDWIKQGHDGSKIVG